MKLKQAHINTSKVMKHIIIIMSLCLPGLPAQSQSMRTVFGALPPSVDLLIDSLKRQDLMDFYESGHNTGIANAFNENCKLFAFSDNYLKLECGIVQLELALLPLINESKIICCIKTACAPVCDSQLTFYTSNWKPIDSSELITPVPTSWFFGGDTLPAIDGFPDIELMQYSFLPDQQLLVQTYKSPEYLTKETKEQIEPLLKNTSKTYEWKKNGFK